MLILELLIIIFLFLGPGILAMFGWSTIDSESVLRSVHPIFYLLVIYSLLRFKELLRYSFIRRNIVLIIFLLFIFRILFDQYIYSRLVGNLLVPLLFLFFILQVNQKEKSRNICKIFFYGLFTLELVLSIYERLTHTLIFPYSLYSPEDFNGMADGGDYFRSNSLLGHPLSNALCVAAVLTFVLVSDLKKSYKNILLILGFTALLCFNARFAIVISFAGYFLYSIFKNRLGVKNVVYLILTIAVISLLVINLNLGDRLLSESIKSDDSSILARIDIFDIFAHFDTSLLYRGTGLDFVEKSLGLLHVENWLLIVLFDFGLITTIYFIYLTVKLSYFPVQTFNKVDKFYIYGVFIIIASSNNSLATQVPVICFLMASAAFIVNSSSASGYLSSENPEALNNRRILVNNSKR